MSTSDGVYIVALHQLYIFFNYGFIDGQTAFGGEVVHVYTFKKHGFTVYTYFPVFNRNSSEAYITCNFIHSFFVVGNY